MASPAKINFKIYQGSTFSQVLRWESSRKIYKTISSITKAAPAIITATAHGVPSGWRVKVTDVVGMKEINNSEVYWKATVLPGNDTIELNDVNSSSFSNYTSGGVLEYNEPVNLSGYTARMHVREKLDSTTTLIDLTTENSGIILDNTAKTITIQLTATQTAALTFKSGVYSLELVSAGGQVTAICTGTITLVKEVTR